MNTKTAASCSRRSRVITLAQLRIASPCTASWDDMKGDERVRHCSDCKLNVYNASGLSENEVLALVEQTEGRLCMRLHRRRDGTVLTRDCPIGLRAAARRQLARLVGAIAAVLMLAGSAIGIIHCTPVDDCQGASSQRGLIGAIQRWLDPPPPVIMGEVWVPPTLGGTCGTGTGE
jgi:hypothetical protein